MKKLLLLVFIFLPVLGFAQVPKSIPADVEAVLKKAGKNRAELERSIIHFQKSGDALKLKAIYFLIANMDIHYSSSYIWVDSAGKHVPFNELAYPTFNEAVAAFNEIRSVTPKIHPQPVTYRDIDSVRANFLIDNVERAFEVWQRPHARHLSFEHFCEYLLPYRISEEPLQPWRGTYMNKFGWIADSARNTTTEKLLASIATDLRGWFTNTWNTETRSEPLPRLGPLQLLQRKRGSCEDIAGLEVYTLRSQGYPASIDFVPYWATSTGRHFYNSTFSTDSKTIAFDVSASQVRLDMLPREPSKVIRVTYSKQPNTLASMEAINNIPEGFLRMQNYIDVTGELWKTRDVKCTLQNQFLKYQNVFKIPPKVAYACVFNGGSWRPSWWGKVEQDAVVFTSMCEGAVFLPAYFIDGKLQPAGYPVVSGKDMEMVLKPDVINSHTITLTWQDKYLVYRAGKRYDLFYWDNAWKKLGSKMAAENTTELAFESVPRNALLLLRPEYSEGKERPFVITDKGERLWW